LLGGKWVTDGKLAIICSNTRATYFLRAAATAILIQLMHCLDDSFDSFMGVTLDFPDDFSCDAAAQAGQGSQLSKGEWLPCESGTIQLQNG
jgi:hypothetical protein